VSSIKALQGVVDTVMEAGGFEELLSFPPGGAPGALAAPAAVALGLLSVAPYVEVAPQHFSRLAELFAASKSVKVCERLWFCCTHTRECVLQSLPDIYHLAAGLRVSADNPVNVPLAVVVDNARNVVLVTDTLGRAVDKVTVRVTSIKSVLSTTNAAPPTGAVTLTAGADGADLSPATGKLSPGLYTLRIAVEPPPGQSRYRAVKVERSYKKLLSLALAATVTVGDDEHSVKFPQSLSKALRADRSHVLEVRLSIPGLSVARSPPRLDMSGLRSLCRTSELQPRPAFLAAGAHGFAQGGRVHVQEGPRLPQHVCAPARAGCHGGL
jgi:hypothetical protein